MSKKQKRNVSSTSRGASMPGNDSRPASYSTATVTGTTTQPVAAPAPRRGPVPFEFKPDYSIVKRDLTRIGILAGGFVVVLVVLSFILK
jgi:hypothetical protein